MVAFKAETAPSRAELARAGERFLKGSGADVVVANDVSGGKGFGADVNSLLMLGRGSRRK